MIQRNDKQVRSTSRNRTRGGARNRRPQGETGRYARTPSRLSLFMSPPRDKPVYSIGELVMVAYERAALVAEDEATEALVATRLLAEWLIHARAAAPLPATAAKSEPVRQPTPRENRMHRVPSRRGAFANAPRFRAAA
jgi:hypothetical protein